MGTGCSVYAPKSAAPADAQCLASRTTSAHGLASNAAAEPYSLGSAAAAQPRAYASAPALRAGATAAGAAKGSSMARADSSSALGTAAAASSFFAGGKATSTPAASKAAAQHGMLHRRMLEDIAEKGLEFFETDKLEAMRETADNLMSVISDLAVDDPTVAMFKEAYAGCYDIIQTVATVAIPPPGGQIVGAALVITAMIIKGAFNLTSCRKLGTRINELLPVVLKHRVAFERGGVAERQVLCNFFDCCQSAQEFIKGVLDQNVIIRTVTWGSTKERLATLDQDLDQVIAALNMTGTLSTFTIVEAAEQENARVQRFIEEKGGAGALARDKAALEQLIGNAGGVDGVSLSMQRDTHVMMQQLQASLVGIVADHEQGPHQLIAHENLKVLWRDCFKHAEVVPWKRFFSVFPQRLQFVDRKEILLIQEELKDQGKRADFRLAVDADNDDNISVEEITQAFPPNVSILEQVRKLKMTALHQGTHYALPTVLPDSQLFGRDDEISKLATFLAKPGCRVAVVTGSAGEGKRWVAVAAMRRLYNEGAAKGGTWYVSMDGVATREQLLCRLVENLSKKARPIDKEFGSATALSARLAEMEELGADVLVLIDNYGDLGRGPAATREDVCSVRDELTQQLVRMLRAVPKLRVVIASREPLDTHTLSTALLELGGAQRVLEIPLRQLATDDAVALVRSVWTAGRRGDAEAVVGTFGHTPQMLSIVAHVIADGRMTCEQVLQCGGMHGLADEGHGVEDAIRRVLSSVLRSLKLLPADFRSHLLRLALVLPSNFDTGVLEEVFEIRPCPGEKLLKQLQKYSFASRDRTSGKARYRVMSVVREAAKACDRDQAAEMGVDLQAVSSVWVKFVALCARLARSDFEEYRRMPLHAYHLILDNKPNVQAALRFAVDQYDAAAPALPNLLAIVGLLPYLAMVHDGPCVTHACKSVGELAESQGDLVGKSLCDAVSAHFLPSRTWDEQEELLAEGGPIDTVCSTLRGSCEARAQWVLVLALRKKGSLLRDRKAFGASLEALSEAVELCSKCDLKSGEALVEHILCLCELSGTMDYMGTCSDMEHGIQMAEEAVERAYAFYGRETAHPVTALALTTLGYHVKNRQPACDGREGDEGDKGDEGDEGDKSHEGHKQALRLHEKALEMRQKVLGKRHTEVAMSLQQCGISLRALGRYEDAEAKLRESLSIRVAALGQYHDLVSRTQRRLADLYRDWDRPSDAARHLRKMLSIGDAIGVPPSDEDLIKAARDLAELEPGEACVLGEKYQLIAASL